MQRCSQACTPRTVCWKARWAGGVAEGREAIEQVYRTFFTSFSTATFEQEQLVIDGDKAAMLLHIHGTNSGGIMGLPATDRPFSVQMVCCAS